MQYLEISPPMLWAMIIIFLYLEKFTENSVLRSSPISSIGRFFLKDLSDPNSRATSDLDVPYMFVKVVK
ncbi:hypothetical protein FQZ97_1033530 [compost metagenome]